jgi:hypothetical protein
MTIILFFLWLLCVFKWGLLFDEKRVLLLVTPFCWGACWLTDHYIATGPRQYSDFWFWVPRDSGQYFTLRRLLDSSDSILLLPHLLHDNSLLYNLSIDYIENPCIVAYISIAAGFCLLSRYLAVDVSSGSAVLTIMHRVTNVQVYHDGKFSHLCCIWHHSEYYMTAY